MQAKRIDCLSNMSRKMTSHTIQWNKTEQHGNGTPAQARRADCSRTIQQWLKCLILIWSPNNACCSLITTALTTPPFTIQKTLNTQYLIVVVLIYFISIKRSTYQQGNEFKWEWDDWRHITKKTYCKQIKYNVIWD